MSSSLVATLSDDSSAPITPSMKRNLKVYRYHRSDEDWHHISRSKMERLPPVSELEVITWNVHGDYDQLERRIAGILATIRHQALRVKHKQLPPPCIIMLQQVPDEGLEILCDDEWVRDYFAILPLSSDKWGVAPIDADREAPTEGNVTLVSRRVPVESASITDLTVSETPCTALAVQVRLHTPPPEGRKRGEPASVMFINTQLESADIDIAPKGRKWQLRRILHILHKSPHGGVVGGDFVALTPEDDEAVNELGFDDMVLRYDGDSDGSPPPLDINTTYTWGTQGGGSELVRRAKLLYHLPGESIFFDMLEPKRLGVARCLPPRSESDDKIWLSEHFGLTTTFSACSELS